MLTLLERRELLHIDIDAVLAIEQAIDLRTDRVLESGLVEALSLCLAGHDQPGRVGRRRLQRLSREEDDCRLHDGEDEREERRCDECEFDRGRAILLADETTRRGRSRKPPDTFCELRCD